LESEGPKLVQEGLKEEGLSPLGYRDIGIMEKNDLIDKKNKVG
jgi:hypothetical protein